MEWFLLSFRQCLKSTNHNTNIAPLHYRNPVVRNENVEWLFITLTCWPSVFFKWGENRDFATTFSVVPKMFGNESDIPNNFNRLTKMKPLIFLNSTICSHKLAPSSTALHNRTVRWIFLTWSFVGLPVTAMTSTTKSPSRLWYPKRSHSV